MLTSHACIAQAPMPQSSGTLRTYGKRFRAKRKCDEVSKRRKVSDDPPIRTPSPSGTDKNAETDTDVEFGEPSTPVKPDPRTPSRPVRDLSGIFDSFSPLSPSTPTPAKLAKRMLGRSKTESSFESQSPSVKNLGKGMDRTSSLPNIPSSSSPAQTPVRLLSTKNENSGLFSRPTIFPPSTASPKTPTTRTYAGNYRSFLMALPASTSGSTTLSKGFTNQDDFETRESYSSLRSRWGVDNSEDDPRPFHGVASPSHSTTTTSEASPSRTSNVKGKAAIRSVPVPDGMINPLKSISELRNKGESRLFLDEVGYLFEGLDRKCGIALRRSRSVERIFPSFRPNSLFNPLFFSALEIATKLCDPEFTRKAKATDFFARTWELFLLAGAGKCEDKVGTR